MSTTIDKNVEKNTVIQDPLTPVVSTTDFFQQTGGLLSDNFPGVEHAGYLIAISSEHRSNQRHLGGYPDVNITTIQKRINRVGIKLP